MPPALLPNNQETELEIGSWLVYISSNVPATDEELADALTMAPKILQRFRENIETDDSLRIFDRCAYIIAFLQGIHFSMSTYTDVGLIEVGSEPQSTISLEEWVNNFDRNTQTDFADLQAVFSQVPSELIELLEDPETADVSLFTKAVFMVGQLDGIYTGNIYAEELR